MQTSYPNVNLFCQTVVALRAVLNDCSCLRCALLTVALNQYFSTKVLYRDPLQQHTLTEQPPSKT